jgi:ubiquinone/menaquinone biosynthesis C-methylase UbiE
MERDEYRRMADVEDAHWWYRATRALLAEHLGARLEPGGLFLDAGSGTGATGGWLTKFGDVVAADVVPMALALYAERHRAVGRVAADLAALPYADDSFDAALCVTVLYHSAIVSPPAAVAELVRVVKPGGVVCLMEPGVRRLFRAHDREVHGARRFSLADLRSLATDAGLTIETATGAYSFLIPPAALKAVLERGKASSDLDNNQTGLGGVLGALAAAERAVLRRRSLPAGLSVVVVGRKPR